MTLGIAIFILGCFYFYYKEPGFRKVAHISGAVFVIIVLLGGLTVGTWYLKVQHDGKVKAAQIQACIAHSTPTIPADTIKEACESDPSKPLDYAALAAKFGGTTEPEPVMALPPGYEDAKPVTQPNVYHVTSFKDINGGRIHCSITLQNRNMRIIAESVPYCWASGVTIGMIPQVVGEYIVLPNEPSYAASSGERFRIVLEELHHPFPIEAFPAPNSKH